MRVARHSRDADQPRVPARYPYARVVDVGPAEIDALIRPRRVATNGHQLPPPPRRSASTASRQARRDGIRRVGEARRRDRIQSIRRVIALALTVALTVAGWSYFRALSAPGTDPWTVRSVEWLKANGMCGAVNWVEHWWYTNNAPPVGGTPKNGLPTAPGAAGSAGQATPKTHLRPPTNMRPLVAAG